MKPFLLALLYKFGSLVLMPYVQSGFFARVEALVLFAMDTDNSGDEKHAVVKKWLADEYGEIQDIVTNLAIELAVARFVLPKKQ
jgi:hypothetical protein